jgi:hypothetical protein
LKIIAVKKLFNSAGSSVSDQINLSDEEKPLTAAVQNQPKWSGRGGQALGNLPPPSPHPPPIHSGSKQIGVDNIKVCLHVG